MASRSGTLLLLPGDGIGPEVVEQGRRVIAWMTQHASFDVRIETAAVGGASYDADGVPVTDSTVAQAIAADAVLFGSVGGPKWDSLPIPLRPERGLLRLRKEMGLFANLRHAVMFDALSEASALKSERVKGLDLMIVRELTGGIYFGEPRGIETLTNGERRGVNTHVYTTSEIRRIAEVGFQIAQGRRHRVHSVEKGNVMEAGALWREEVDRLGKERYPDVALQQMYADACAMALIRKPTQFDVILTDNLFGDILSDEAAEIVGSLGMMPTASLGEVAANGRRHALYEPAHGSAPDIENQDKANPIAMILSVAMCLRYSFHMNTEASLIEQAVQRVLDRGSRTADIMQSSMTAVSTSGMGSAILEQLDQLRAA